MRRVLAFVIVLAARPALAGPTCDGGSDDTSSFSDSDDDDHRSTEPACIETSDVHGYRTCTPFGKWGRSARWPSLFVSAGTAMRRFASPMSTTDSTVTHDGESFRYRVTRPERAALDTAIVAQVRAGIGLRHGFYGAIELEAGGLADGSTNPEMMSSGVLGTPEIRAAGVAVLGGAIALGARLRSGVLDAGLEGVAGVRTLVYQYESHYLACETTTSITATTPVFEARGRAALWLTPFISLGVTAGRSLVDDAWITGLHLGASTRAFGGR
ncbi:MAG: hypothetical protein H0T46_35890 [Deltaproteobacteria bacterium]|nr:hypothetical protein [Deltaproteobacteria bacterium]